MSMQLHIAFMLHKGKRNKNGFAPLVVRLTYQKQRKEISSGFMLTEKEWERVQQGKRLSEDHLKTIVSFIDSFKVKVYQVANTLELQDRMDLKTLVHLCLNKQRSNIMLMELFQQHQEELTKRTAIDRAKATLSEFAKVFSQMS